MGVCVVSLARRLLMKGWNIKLTGSVKLRHRSREMMLKEFYKWLIFILYRLLKKYGYLPNLSEVSKKSALECNMSQYSIYHLNHTSNYRKKIR